MNHCRKALEDQIEILWRHANEGKELNCQFIRDHAIAIVQLTDEMTFAKSEMTMSVGNGSQGYV